TQPKRKSSTRRHKVSLQNGKLSNGGSHVANGSRPRADELQKVSAGEPLLNGHHADTRTNPVTSDSDSEVYCDSVDQFGQEEARQTLRNMILDHILLITPLKVSFFAQSSEHNRSLDDLEEEESHVLLVEENVQDPPQAVRCGGEEGETGGTVSQRPRLNVDMLGSSLARRAQGSRSPGLGPGPQLPMHSSGDGDGEPWGGVLTSSASLNEQIVVALARLQEDMQSVLERLRTLEALTANQVRPASPVISSLPQCWLF
ncbi:hypothetical protein XENOCAPTIV_027696, partial [Xenoophorus captivus]